MSEFVTEAFTLLAVAIVIIALRTTARWIMVGPKNFQADDYVMLVACVCINQYVLLIALANEGSGRVWIRNGRGIHCWCVV